MAKSKIPHVVDKYLSEEMKDFRLKNPNRKQFLLRMELKRLTNIDKSIQNAASELDTKPKTANMDERKEFLSNMKASGFIFDYRLIRTTTAKDGEFEVEFKTYVKLEAKSEFQLLNQGE